MFRCFFARRRFTDYLDGALDRKDEARLARHLERCRRCERLFSEMRAVAEVSGSRPAPSLDETFWKRFDSGLAHKLNERIEKEAVSDPRPVFGRFLLLPRPALITASIVIVILAVGLRLTPYARTMLRVGGGAFGRVAPAADETAALAEELAMLDEVSHENGADEGTQEDYVSELEVLYLLDPASFEQA